MRYHNITKDDMLNGEGLRVVLWLSGCDHHCEGCQNPITWNPCGGLEFDLSAKSEVFTELDKKYITGITFSGGDPLHENNLESVYNLCTEIKERYPQKTIWLYTGYTYEEAQYLLKGITPECIKFNNNNRMRQRIISLCDVLVDGKFVNSLSDINYHWAGSTNQRVIDVHSTLKNNKVTLYKSKEKNNENLLL